MKDFLHVQLILPASVCVGVGCGMYVNWAVLLSGREIGLRARGHCFKPYEVIVLYRLRKAKKTKTRNRYSQVTHLARDTVLERSYTRESRAHSFPSW